MQAKRSSGVLATVLHVARDRRSDSLAQGSETPVLE